MKSTCITTLFFLISVLTFLSCQTAYKNSIRTSQDVQQTTLIDEDYFTNPISPCGAAPWVTQKNGTYYFAYTQERKIVL